MDTNSNRNDRLWIEDKLSALDVGAAWQPDTTSGLERFRQGRGAARSHNRRWVWAVAAATVVCLGLPAFPVTRAFAARCVDACVGVTTKVGQFFRPAQSTATKEDPALWLANPELRPVAPDFSLADAKGAQVSLSNLRGQVVLVNFWATWCPPCKVEIPWFVEFQTRHRGRLSIVGISLDDDGWTSVGPFAEAEEINYRLAMATEDVLKAFGGVGSLPATFLVDRQGRIAVKHTGIVAKAEYESELERILSEK